MEVIPSAYPTYAALRVGRRVGSVKKEKRSGSSFNFSQQANESREPFLQMVLKFNK